MMRVLGQQIATPHSGLRRLDVRRDMSAIAELISDAFAAELDAQGRRSLRELRSLARLGPLLYLLVPASGEMGSFFRGFVWEDEGRIVGNVTLHEVVMGRRLWMISNVAVAQSHRGRGIARRLMEAAEARINELGGEWIVLQVRADNARARTLYEHMQYQPLYSETHLRCYPEARAPSLPLPQDASLYPLPYTPLSALHTLLQESQPEDVRWWQQRSAQRFRQPHDTGLALKIKQVLGWSHRRRWGVFRSSQLLGVLEVHVAPSSGHRIDILLQPDLRPAWTRPLLAYGLQQLQSFGSQITTAQLYDYQSLAIRSLQDFGFRVVRELITMRKSLTQS